MRAQADGLASGLAGFNAVESISCVGIGGRGALAAHAGGPFAGLRELNRSMTGDSWFPTLGLCWAGEAFAPSGRPLRRIPARTRTIHLVRSDLTGRRDESRGYALHRMTRIEQSAQSGGNAVAEKRIDLSYDAASQWQTITRYADLAGTKLVATSDYTFDTAGRLTGLTYAQGATPLAGYTWTYDAAHRVTEFTSLLDGTAEYTYDQTDQLTGADYTAGAGLPPAPPDEAYGYDANGNRTMTGHATGDNNLVLSDGTYDYQYDAEGNRTRRTHIATGEVTEYEWDHRNRLTRVTIRTTDNGPLTTDILYAYDLFNRLVRVTLHTTDNGPLTTDTFHIYDGERWERGNAGDHLALAFDGNGDLTNRCLHGPAVDQILADEQLDSLTTPGDVLWPLTDNLGTVRDLAAYDYATGDTTVVNHRTYTAFGEILDQTDPTIHHRFAYTGREWDEHAGLYHYRARWYDPLLGRFLSEDPIRFEAGDANLQRYVGNGPTNATDPSGLERVNYPRADLTPPAPNLPFWIDPYHPLLSQQREQTEALRQQSETLWQELTEDLRRVRLVAPPDERRLPYRKNILEGAFSVFIPGLKGAMQQRYGTGDVQHFVRDKAGIIRDEAGNIVEYRLMIGGTTTGVYVPTIPRGFLVGAEGAGPCILLIITSPPNDAGTRSAWAYHFGTKHNPSSTLRRDGGWFGFPRGSKAVLGGGDDRCPNSMGTLFYAWDQLQRQGISIDGIYNTPSLWVDADGNYHTFPHYTVVDDGTFPTPDQFRRLQEQLLKAIETARP
jgi:RHS repeat-associated protein